MLQQPELLAPAGSLETLKYAVMYGADAVYCALPEFGMRAAPVNLTVGELHEGCIFAHARGKKVYLTLNTLPTNEELSKLPRYIQDAAEAGVEVAGYYSAAPSGEAELVLVVSGGGNEALCVLGGRFGEEEALRLATMQREQLLGRGGTR